MRSRGRVGGAVVRGFDCCAEKLLASVAPGTRIVSTWGLGVGAQVGDVWQITGGKLNGGPNLSGLRGVGVWGFGFWVSGKMVLLDRLLPKLKARDSRVLIFSQVK